MYAAIALPSPRGLSIRFAADSCHVVFDALCVVFLSMAPGRRNRRREKGRTMASFARGSWLRHSHYRLRELLPLAGCRIRPGAAGGLSEAKARFRLGSDIGT